MADLTAHLTSPALDLASVLVTIRIVMVNTTLPANIGSAARAMYTMGLTQLVVVEPKKPIDEDAYAHAAGAKSILDHVTIVPTLSAALQDCQWVFATSSRQRHIPKPVLTPTQAATLFLQQVQALGATQLPNIAIVFGREDRGLTNDELNLADYHIQIPANPAYSVLNVAAAVQVIASVFYDVLETGLNTRDSLQSSLADQETMTLNFRQQWDEPPINHKQQQQVEQQLLQLLQQLGIFHREQSKVIPQRVGRLFSRLQLDMKEYQLLQAMIATIIKKIHKNSLK